MNNYVVYGMMFSENGVQMKIYGVFDTEKEAQRWLKLPGNELCTFAKVRKLFYSKDQK